MYTPVNPSFTINNWGEIGCSLHGLVFAMCVIRITGGWRIVTEPWFLERGFKSTKRGCKEAFLKSKKMTIFS